MNANNSSCDSVQGFYDGWAQEYHLIFADWKESVKRQGKVLDHLIRSRMGAKAQTLLDCTCGIGTQAIGLASEGYRVSATDLSPKAVARTLKEAENCGVGLSAKVADIRKLDTIIGDVFDVVLTCDNSICHLLEDEDLELAARQMYARVRPGGLFLASIRDYDGLKKSGAGGIAAQQLPGEFKSSETELPRATVPRVFDDKDGRRIIFQVWDWSPDGKSYTVNQFSLTQSDGSWQTSHRASRFRAVLRSELEHFLQKAGFKDICWHMPEQSGFYQPVVTAQA